MTYGDVLLYRSNGQVVQFSAKIVNTFYKTAASLLLDTHILTRTKFNSVPVIYRLALNIKSENYPPF